MHSWYFLLYTWHAKEILFHRSLFIEPIQTNETTVTGTKSTTTKKKTNKEYFPLPKK